MVHQLDPVPQLKSAAGYLDCALELALHAQLPDEELVANFRRFERKPRGAELRMQTVAAGLGASAAASTAADAAASRGLQNAATPLRREKALNIILRQPLETWTAMTRHVLDAFYSFAFAVCRDPGKKHLQVDRAVALWRVLLHGRFRLLDRFCAFVESSPRLVVNEDTWRQVLDFSRSVLEDLSNFDVSGAWPVLLDEFVESLQLQRTRSSTLSSRPEPRPSPWTLLWPGSGETPGSDGVALAGVSPVAGSKRRHPDVDGLTSRLEAARLANVSPHNGSLRASEGLVQPLKRLHIISSPG